ncbi:MAG: hypothetical protein ACOCXH_15000 [Cyclobacteriaceae bacterium]
MNKKKNTAWKITYSLAVLLAIITFTPLVIPYNQAMPMLGNIPYTLWTGILVYILFVILTLIGTKVYPKDKN